jgi:hypothetical protein
MKEKFKELEKKQDNSSIKVSRSNNLGGTKRCYRSIIVTDEEILTDSQKKQKVQHNE